MSKGHIGAGLASLSVGTGDKSSNITLLVLTRIGPGFSGSEMSGWRVDSCTLTCEDESGLTVAMPRTLIVVVFV